MKLDPHRPVLSGDDDTPDDLKKTADEIESWATPECSPRMVTYYKERAAFYRAEAVRRMIVRAA